MFAEIDIKFSGFSRHENSSPAQIKARFNKHSTTAIPGVDGKSTDMDKFSGNSLAVLSSGGDSQGMNSAIRAIVRMGIHCGCRVYVIREGYQGLCDGAEYISEVDWWDVSGIMPLGGTIIGSARCMDFQEVEGRLKAAENLIQHSIHNLVIIGGDGSLTGANIFRAEWPTLIDKLLAEERITKKQHEDNMRLNIVGIVGSIDNDFCGTDMTIGADSALHRVIEMADDITTTAASHKRCFILEVMGRACGYLALISALACEADWVFIPEVPPDDDWPVKLCSKVKQNREMGQRVIIIILAEGAADNKGRPIKCDEVKDLMVDKLGLDTRITVLGHVQRGGCPSAFDRVLGIRMGAEAVFALMDADKNPDLPACVITLSGNQTMRLPLMQCVEKTHKVAQAIAEKDFKQAVLLRGSSFKNNVEMYLTLSKLTPPKVGERPSVLAKLRVAVVNVGAPACGINAAMRTFARLSIAKGYRVIGIVEGFHGLINNEVKDIRWNDVTGWVGAGGSMLGARRDSPNQLGLAKIAARFGEQKINGLLVIGGFEAYESMLELEEGRKLHPEFCIPIVMIPASISNNIPGTDFAIGTDTALNVIMRSIDKIHQSATGTKRRVFVVETMGGYCGYLATLSGLGGGADAAYIHEEPYSIEDLCGDVTLLRSKMVTNVQRGLVLRSESANTNYSTDFIHRLYSEEAHGVFDCRSNVLGHVQQGGHPSPFDRNMGTKFGALAIEWLDNQINENLTQDGQVYTKDDSTCCILGHGKRSHIFSKVTDLKLITDFKYRVPKENWWMKLRPLMRIMAKHECLYETQSVDLGDDHCFT